MWPLLMIFLLSYLLFSKLNHQHQNKNSNLSRVKKNCTNLKVHTTNVTANNKVDIIAPPDPLIPLGVFNTELLGFTSSLYC